MNLDPIKDFIAKAKEDQKLAAAPVVILLAIIFIGYKFAYSPQKTLLTKQQKENKGVQDQINSLKAACDNLEGLKIEVAELKKGTELVARQCYRKYEAPVFLQNIREVAKQNGLSIRSINPLPTVPKKFAEILEYEEYPVRIAFEGDFIQLGKFLRAMERYPRLIYLKLPPLKPNASGSFRMDLEPSTILIPENFGELKPPEEAPEGGG